jgi:hypothetical protein
LDNSFEYEKSILFSIMIKKKLLSESIDELIEKINNHWHSIIRYDIDVLNYIINNIIITKKIKFYNVNQIIFFIQKNIHIQKIIFDNQFNQPLNHIELKKLVYLKFGHFYNQSLNNICFLELKELVLGNNFTKQLNNIYAPKLSYLTIYSKYPHQLTIKLNKLSLIY